LALYSPCGYPLPERGLLMAIISLYALFDFLLCVRILLGFKKSDNRVFEAVHFFSFCAFQRTALLTKPTTNAYGTPP
jgi:hypothetical protein